MFGRTMVIAAFAGLVFFDLLSSGIAFAGDRPDRAQVESLRAEAQKFRQQANDLDKQAEEWQALAAEGKAKAATTVDAKAKSDLLLSVSGYEQKASQLRQFAADKRKRADGDDARADQLQAELDGLPLPQVGGNANANTVPPAGGAGLANQPGPQNPLGVTGPVRGDEQPAAKPASDTNCGVASGAGNGCPTPDAYGQAGCDHSKDTSIADVADIFGIWVNDRGDRVTIRPQAGSAAGEIVWESKFWWSGTFARGKLAFNRFPRPEEMGAAPLWAREIASVPLPTGGGPTMPLGGATPGAGYVQWELELDAKTECGQPIISGKFYPGSFKWSQKTDPAGNPIEASRQVSDIGRGTPVDVRYTKQLPAIVGVAVLENQTRRDSLPVASPDGQPRLDEPGAAFVYPFQPGADDTGAALSTRTLFIYGYDLPKTRDGTIKIVSEDPNIAYLVLAVQADWEINAGIEARAKFGRRVAKASRSPLVAPEIDKMDGILVRATLRRGVIPGYKNLLLNGAAAGWPLRFGDDVALITFARAGNGALTPPAAMAQDRVMPTQFLFRPERTFIEVRTEGTFPIESIELRVGIDDRKIEWSGRKTITARRVLGSPTVYRTDPIELVAPRTQMKEPPGAYYLPAEGARIFVALDNPWLLRTNSASATLLDGPGELGHTFKYYLGRAAVVDKVDPLPDLSTLDGWRQLSGKTADTLTDITILTGYLGKGQPPRTWKQWFIDWHQKLNRPPWYYIVHVDDILPTIRVSVAEHAALLFLRDTFVAKMDREIPRYRALRDDYTANRNSVAMRGFRDDLKAIGWNTDSPWRYIQVTCPGQASVSATVAGKAGLKPNCSLPYALSDTFIKQAFPSNDLAGDRWSLDATDEALKTLIDAAIAARDKAKGLAETDIRGMLKILGRNYEPLILDIASRLMTRDASGKWVPDTAALYSLTELHQLTDAVVALDDLQTADAVAVIQLALMPIFMAAGPALIAEEALAGEAVSWGLYASTAVLDVAEAYFKLPDIRFALGASLAIGAEQLSAAIAERDNIYFGTIEKLAESAIANYGVGEFVHVGKSAFEVYGRPAIASLRRGGLAAFKKLQRRAQEAVLAAILRAKGVQQSGQLAFASAFERDAVTIGDALMREAGIQPPKPPAENPIAATGNPLAKAETASVRLPDPAIEIESEVIRYVEPGGGASAGAVDPQAVTPTLPAQAPTVDPAVAVARAWRGAPKAGAEVTLLTEAGTGGMSATYRLGRRLGTPGAYVWTLEIAAENGTAPATPEVLKLAGVGDYRYSKGLARKDFFTGKEMVENSARGYQLVTERTDIRVLSTRFYPNGIKIEGGARTALPFMEQEALGPSRRLLDDVLRAFGEGKVPRELSEAIGDMWAKFLKGGIYPQDMNWKNVWVELKGADDAMWTAYLKSGNSPVELGLLDFDRIVPWDEYVARRSGKMGEFLNWVELKSMPGKVLSMARVFGDDSNAWLWAANDRALNGIITARPGPYIKGDLSYALEKQLEFHNYLRFDPSSRRVISGAVDIGVIEARFPAINDSSRFEPYPLLNAPPPGTASNPRRRLGRPAIRRRTRPSPSAPGRRKQAALLPEAA